MRKLIRHLRDWVSYLLSPYFDRNDHPLKRDPPKGES